MAIRRALFRSFKKAIEEFPQHKNLPLLIEKQIEKFDTLHKELAEFVRKQDYKCRDEPWGKEIDSWKRSVEMVTGKKGVFSNQMRLPDGQVKE